MYTAQLCCTPPLTATTVPTSHYTYSTYVHPDFLHCRSWELNLRPYTILCLILKIIL